MAEAATERKLTPRELLDEACARNLSAEIHYEQRNELRVARLRMLKIDSGQLTVDQPQAIGEDLFLRGGMLITLYFNYAGEWYNFRTKVVRPLERVDLNQHKRIAGAILEVPKHVEKGHRRHDFRLSLAALQLEAMIHVIEDMPDLCAPRNAERISGVLSNVSGGGAQLITEERLLNGRIKIGTHWCLSFTPPESDRPIVLPVMPRHLRSIRDNTATAIGLQFRDLKRENLRPMGLALQQFIQTEQRNQVQRRSSQK